MLDGKVLTFAELVHQDRQRWGALFEEAALVRKDIETIPSKTETIRRFAKSKRKAVPEDGLGG